MVVNETKTKIKNIKVVKAAKEPIKPSMKAAKKPTGGSINEIDPTKKTIGFVENIYIENVINNNNIHFKNKISEESMAALCKDLRSMDEKLRCIRNNYKIDKIPIYLYITTDGGDIYSAMSAIDCILELESPVYTIIDGFVASAGTLLSIIGEKRFIQPNAYILIHELRSDMWGKMSRITDEYNNLQKIMKHIKSHYAKYTKFNIKQLDTILKSDIIWNAEEAIKYGLADKIYKNK